MNSSLKTLTILILFSVLTVSACNTIGDQSEQIEFLGERAFDDIEYQLSLGPRMLGSEAHRQTREWIIESNDNAGWDVEIQRAVIDGQEIYNIIAKRENGPDTPWIIIGAHYDSRSNADNDPNIENHSKPVLGANDGASGVAILMELARVIPKDPNGRIWLVYFDAEDNGNLPIPGGEWILGSQAFVDSLEGEPDSVVVVDMIGDADLNIFMERNSTRKLTEEIWEIAAALGYQDQFISQPKWTIIDDHLPFVQAGIPAVDIIDFDYPFWHTVEDTIDKVSPESLQIVGDVVLTWLLGKFETPQ